MNFLITMISRIGIAGLLLTMAIEGSSVPFPGIIIVFTLGYILNLNTTNMLVIALGMSFVYSAASLIPYEIGYKLENVITQKYEKQVKAAQKYFKKYGEYSIMLLRPFAVGNYISYIAGMSRVKIWRYLLFTFIGIYPWSLIVLFIGRISKGNISSGTYLIEYYIRRAYIPLLIIALLYILKLLFEKLRTRRR